MDRKTSRKIDLLIYNVELLAFKQGYLRHKKNDLKEQEEYELEIKEVRTKIRKLLRGEN